MNIFTATLFLVTLLKRGERIGPLSRGQAMNHYLIVAMLFLIGCANAGTNTSSVSPDEEPIQGEPTFDQRVYFLQRHLISNWVFESDGKFFFDIYNGNVAQFIDEVAEIVTPEYSEKIDIKPIGGRDAVLIVFPEPETSPHCYYALIKKDGDEYAYYTYEKSLDLWGPGGVGVVGGWDDEGNHLNFGPRNYSTAKAFVRDVLDDDAEPASD